jgi:hypothetical protein
MNRRAAWSILASVALLTLAWSVEAHAQQAVAELHGKNNVSKQTALTEKGDVVNDRQGLRDDDASKSWNSSHASRGPDGGCSQNDLKTTGGAGLFYCFATK